MAQTNNSTEPIGKTLNLPEVKLFYPIEQQPLPQVVGQEVAPLLVGYTSDIKYPELEAVGQWDTVFNTIHVWRALFKTEAAAGMHVYFSDVRLRPTERLFVYNPTKKVGYKTYTEANNGLHLASDTVTGNAVMVEYITSNDSRELPFHLSEIGVLIGDKINKGFGDAGDCEVHINCSEGDNWQKQKRGVARIILKQGSYTYLCSGTLVNNTKLDGKPYFLTANHCGQTATSADYAQWLFYFNYEAEGCEKPPVEPSYNVLNGSKLLARSVSNISTASDFKLLLLDDNPPDNFNPYFNGWSRSADASPSGVSIHHPQGDLKMISTYTQPLASSQYTSNIDDPDGLYWRVYWSETENGHGVTEGGSSGSPIFNDEGLVVGSLTGGGSSCDFLTSPDFYGKFNVSWQPNGSTDSTRILSYWLDPLNLGVVSLQGSDLDTTNLTAWFTALDTEVVVGETVGFSNSSFGNITRYEWEFEGGYPQTSTEKEPGEVRYEKSGLFDVRLIVYSNTNSDTLERQNYINVMPLLSPNPGNGYFTISFGDIVPEDIEVRVFDLFGNEVDFKLNQINENQLQVDISNCRVGMYIIQYTSGQLSNTFKVNVIK